MRRKTKSIAKNSSDNKLKVIRSGKGSFELVKKHKSKGIFYCVDEENNSVNLVENLSSYSESTFKSLEELNKYLEEKYT